MPQDKFLPVMQGWYEQVRSRMMRVSICPTVL
jgi:hypothetical protein